VTLEPVAVRVSALDLLDFDGTCARLAMRVSAGFYVRSLAHELGQALGMGAVLEALRRTQAGAFGLDEAVPLSELAGLRSESLGTKIVPLGRLLPDVPARTLATSEVLKVRRGLDIEAGTVRVPTHARESPAVVRLLDPEGELVALATPARQAGFLHPSVVLG
jgi:tRNA pseudouridine55 synthase